MVGGGGIWGFGCLLFLFVYLIVSFFLYFFAIGCFYVLSDLRVEMEELEEFCVDSKCWEVGGVFFFGYEVGICVRCAFRFLCVVFSRVRIVKLLGFFLFRI